MNSEGGPYFASAGDDVKLWDASSFNVVKHYSFHKGTVKDLAWSRDNSFLCSTASSGDKLLLTDCNLQLNESPKIIAEHATEEHQTCVRVSPSGRKIYSGGVDGTLFVWDKDSGKVRKFYKDTHQSPITCIALNTTETHLASGSSKGDIVIRNLSNDTQTNPGSSANGQAVRGMEFSPWKPSLLGMTLDDGSLNLWDTLLGKSYHNFPQIHSGPAMDLIFSPFNDLVLASVGLDKHLMVFDVKRHKYLNKVKADQPLTSLTFLNDGYSIFVGSSLGTIYQYDLRHFSRSVNSVLAHMCSIQRIALQNVMKPRKDRSRSSKTDSREKHRAGDEGVTKRQNSLRVGGQSSDEGRVIDGRGDNHFGQAKSSSSDKSSVTSNGREVNNKTVSNGYRPTETRPKPLENSTPTGRLKQDFPLNVDDMGGLISPLREDVFNGTAATANDANFSVLPHDPSLMGATFSSSVDTIGSYCDDVLSPIAPVTRNSKGLKMSVTTQAHSKISPHPLRQSYSVAQTNKSESSSNLRNSAPAPSSLKSQQHKVQSDFPASTSTDNLSKPMINGTKSDVSTNPLTKKPIALASKTTIHSQTTASTSIDSYPGTYSVKEQPNQASTSQPSVSSQPTSTAIPTGMSAFQYQADYLRNTIKEMVDDMGDDLRRQINGLHSAMVKLSMLQEDFITKSLNERRCDINETLLRECERLREENERLRTKIPYL